MAVNDVIRIYTADEMIFSFGPAIVDSGLGEDEFIRIEPEVEDTEDVAGVDGEVAVSRTNDRRANIFLTIMQTSIHNDTLSVLRNLVVNANGMAGGIHPFLVKDPNGRSVYTGQNAWITAAPSPVYSRKATMREWKIRCANLVRVDGGN